MKKIKYLNLLIIVTLICSMFMSVLKVRAIASATVGFSGNSTVSVGDKITITMYVSNVTDTTGGVVSVGGNLSFDSEYLEYVSSTGATSPYTFQINTGANYIIAGLDTTLTNGITSSGQTKVFTFVFKALKAGTTKVTLTNAKLSDTSSKITTTVSPKTITITSNTDDDSDDSDDKTNDPTPGTTGSTGSTGSTTGTTTGTTSTTKKSSDATLKKLNVSGYTLSPTFKSGVNTYSMKVKNSVTGLGVTAIANDSKATVKVSGNSNWKEGINVVTIKVTAEDGTVNNYIVNVTRESSDTDSKEEEKSSDNYLKNLTINSSHNIDQEFDKDISTYNITVPNEVENLDLTCTANNSKATVKITGNENFKVGDVNIVQIEVIAEDGTKRLYTLNVTRSNQSSETDLKDLTVDGATLSPKFDKDVLEYTVTVDGKADKLDITALTASKDSTVEIIGNENLKEGNNTVLVKVTDKNGFTKYYTINVKKQKKQTKILGLTPLQFGIISGIIGLLFLIILILLLLKRKKKEEKEEDNKFVSPIIEVKPEFNFGSKNTSDDDVVHGNLNQNSELLGDHETSKQRVIDADYEENIPYDPYDDIVTKDELVDAIEEATRTNDSSKLKMLLEQEALNRKKEKLRRKEELRKRDMEEEMDDWR